MVWKICNPFLFQADYLLLTPQLLVSFADKVYAFSKMIF